MEIRLEIDQSRLDYDEINKKILEKIDGLSSEDVLRFAYPKISSYEYRYEDDEDEPNSLTKLITRNIISSILTNQPSGKGDKIFNENTGELTYVGSSLVDTEFRLAFKKHISELMKPITESDEINKLLIDTFFNSIAAIYVQVLRDYCEHITYNQETQDERVRSQLQSQIDEIKSRFNMYH